MNAAGCQRDVLADAGTLQVALPSGRSVRLRVDDHTDPWSGAPTLVLLHGTAETGDAYRQWVPALSRHFRVLRPDLRGMGGTPAGDLQHGLGLAELARDVYDLLGALGVSRAHFAGAKLGGLIALTFAARFPEATGALSVACGLPSPRRALGGWIPEWTDLVRTQGVSAWVNATQPGRMGTELSPAALAWWSRLMSESIAPETLCSYFSMEAELEMHASELGAIRAPVQLLLPSRPNLATEGSVAMAYDQRRTSEELEAWRQIPRHSRLLIESDSFHVAATHPQECADATRTFLLGHPMDTGSEAQEDEE